MPVLKTKRDLAKIRKRKAHCHRLKYVPKEMLTEVIARVASASLTDLFNAKIVCKEFYEAGSENYVLENVTIKKFPVIPWRSNDGALSFFNRCKESGNPEALFREGMMEFFSSMKPESGLQYLKRAAEKGHVEAIYVYGIILICYGGKFKEEGIMLLSSKLNRFKIEKYRSQIKPIIWSMWINNYIVGVGPDDEPKNQARTCSCYEGTLNTLTRNRGWTNHEEDDGEEEYTAFCDSCLWAREAILFCNLLRTGSFFRSF